MKRSEKHEKKSEVRPLEKKSEVRPKNKFFCQKSDL